MKSKTMVLLTLLLALVAVGAVYGYKYYTTKQPVKEYHASLDFDDLYPAEAETEQALARFKQGVEKAPLIKGSPNGTKTIALAFDGLTDKDTINRILAVLKKHNVKATFFADGLHVVEEPQIVAAIRGAGQDLESFSLRGMPKLETLPVERLAKDFSRGKKILEENGAVPLSLLKCNETKYTDNVLKIAKAAGFKGVVVSDQVIDVRKAGDSKSLETAVASVKPGQILSIKLLDPLDITVEGPVNHNVKPAEDKQPGLKEMAAQDPGIDVAARVESIVVGLKKQQYGITSVAELTGAGKPTAWQALNNASHLLALQVEQFKTLLSELVQFPVAYAAENPQKAAEEMKLVFTTEQAVAFTFSGLTNETAVNDVLEYLQQIHSKGTFFIAETELRKNPQLVKKILARQHEVGIAIRSKDGERVEETKKNLKSAEQLLKAQFGISTKLVKQTSGAVTDTTRQAVSELGYTLVGQTITIVQSKHKDYTSADAVMGEVFKKGVVSLARGQIVHFRMDFYTDPHLTAALVRAVKEKKMDNIPFVTFYDSPENNPKNQSAYVIQPVGAMLANTAYRYQYPVDIQKVPLTLQQAAPTTPISKDDFLRLAAERYIGNVDVTPEERMVHFSQRESRRMDEGGFVHTEEPVIFITFDDWGSDASINKLLYVLRKHHAKATFFVITKNMSNNVNLLRSIAQEGHDIGSHTESHIPMALPNPQTHSFEATQSKEEYKKDVSISYEKLRDAVGDVQVEGKPSLTRFFRPPQLAISKEGMEALLESGYTFIVSGSTSTKDYMAESVPALVHRFEEGLYTDEGTLRKGTILVMHMSDTAQYTATALDLLLTANEAKPDSDPSKFKVGKLSDYLFDGYSQMNKKQTMRKIQEQSQRERK